MKNTLIFLAMLFSVFSFASAQESKKENPNSSVLEVGMYVKDFFTHEQVPNLKGELLMAADSSFVDSLTYMNIVNIKQVFAIAKVKSEGKYLIRFHADGYVTTYTPVNITKIHKREKDRTLPHVYMHKVPKEKEFVLDEVVVKATKLKFYMDGDTLVYDADAFQTAEGSMLGDLLRKLPGVEVEKGGVIKVNGREVDAIMLNGSDFFDKDKNLLLENLPSYMVKTFNIYEKTPDMVAGTKFANVTKKEFVMDVRLKKEYSVGWIANAEAGGGATFHNNADGNKDAKFLGRLFGLRFTKYSRLVLFANANNLNDYRNPGDNGDWEKLSQSEGLTSSVKAGANFSLKSDFTKDNQIRYEGSIEGSYSDKDDANHTSSATFLDDGNTFGKSFHTKRSYEWNVNTGHTFIYEVKKVKNIAKQLFTRFNPEFKYTKWDNRASSASATLAEDVASGLGKAWMDSITAPNAGDLLKRYAINRTISSTQGAGHSMDAQMGGVATFHPLYNEFLNITLSFNGKVADRGDDTFEHYILDYPREGASASDYRNRYTPISDKTQHFDINPSIDISLRNRQKISLKYSYAYDHADNNNPLYLLNKLERWEQPYSHPLSMLPSEEEMLKAIDKENSMRSDKTTHTQSPEISYSRGGYDGKTGTWEQWRVWAGLNIANERQDYQQGVLIDTLMRRTTALPTGGISFNKNNYGKGYIIWGYYNINVSAPSMTSLLNIRNDRDPLNITLGNPNLRNTVNHEVQFIYRNKLGKTFFNVGTVGSLKSNAIAYGFIYDKETGVRITKPQNVNGNWLALTHGGVDFPLDKNDRWRLNNNGSYEYRHSVDLAGTNAMMEATRSTVGSHYITDDLSLKYTPNQKMEFGINGSLTYQNSTSNRESFQTLNVFTYHYGATAQLELPLGIQFSTDLTMYSRRGYSEASMNTNELVWNARVAKKLMHGNMTLMFDGFDLLGNLSNVRRTINAQGRTETFYNVIPSYGLFHVIYRLNKQPKKKE